MILFLDTETTGLPVKRTDPWKSPENWPRLVELAWIVSDSSGTVRDEQSFLIRPDGFTIPEEATKIHGISTEMAVMQGQGVSPVLERFLAAVKSVDLIVAHNLEFDRGVLSAELSRLGGTPDSFCRPGLCTMIRSTAFCNLPNKWGNKKKWPSLSELYTILFSRDMEQNHRALDDVKACLSCYYELKRRGVIEAV